MSFDVLSDLNWLAVIVAGIAYFAVGAIWYAPPVFGKAWQRSTGLGMPEGERPGPEYYYGPFITCLIASIAVGMIAEATGSDGVGDGLVLGLVAGIGIAGSVLAVTGLFDTKKPDPKVATRISIGYHLVGLVVASVIVSVWR